MPETNYLHISVTQNKLDSYHYSEETKSSYPLSTVSCMLLTMRKPHTTHLCIRQNYVMANGKGK